MTDLTMMILTLIAVAAGSRLIFLECLRFDKPDSSKPQFISVNREEDYNNIRDAITSAKNLDELKAIYLCIVVFQEDYKDLFMIFRDVNALIEMYQFAAMNLQGSV